MFTGEQSDTQWCAEGNIHVVATSKKTNDGYDITLNININNGWHITQIQNIDDTVPIKIEMASNTQLTNFKYPDPISKSLGFQSET